jgi:DNA-binding phage protein
MYLINAMKILAKEAKVDEYVVACMRTANPKIWIQKARRHVAAQKAHRAAVRNWGWGK